MDPETGSGPLASAVLLGAGAFVLFLLELVIPSGGLLAILCILCAIGSVVVGFFHGPMTGMILLAAYSIAAPFLIVLGLRVATRSRIGRRMVLRASDPARTVPSDTGEVDGSEAPPAMGATGEALTPLRPSGFVRIESRRLDATAEGDFIDAGVAIEVVGHRDGHLRVRPRRG